MLQELQLHGSHPPGTTRSLRVACKGHGLSHPNKPTPWQHDLATSPVQKQNQFPNPFHLAQLCDLFQSMALWWKRQHVMSEAYSLKFTSSECSLEESTGVGGQSSREEDETRQGGTKRPQKIGQHCLPVRQDTRGRASSASQPQSGSRRGPRGSQQDYPSNPLSCFNLVHPGVSVLY